jgi:hypothetical protein
MGARPRDPVKVENVSARRDGKCRVCKQSFAKGETVTRIRLRKSYRQVPCACGRKLAGLKYFHVACAPADPVLAMGITPAQVAQGPAGAAPPPKPMTAQEATLAAMVAFEKALSLRVHRMTPEQKAEAGTAFDKYRKLKALALSPGTDAEGATAMKLAAIALIKLVY